ncbi:hypothetical protein DFH11DRAFT_43267 [Phellopilus nigrolimitatus]|nr:hypothetical protein DFH11DRAFT_43267 [Phellopilus nigrolimitatus]
MLKRQRPSTPPPSMAETPSSADFMYGEPNGFAQSAKRRRIVAPALDGRQRGMYDDDEGGLDDDEEIDTAYADNPQTSSHWEEQAGQYKDANILLHRLHLEHQRRAQSSIFSSPPTPSSAYTDFTSTLTPTQLTKRTTLSTSAQYPNDSRLASSEGHPQGSDMAQESNQVRSRYEHNNKLLGSIVRKRMREHNFKPE